MKRIICLVLSFIMLVSVVSCAHSDKDDGVASSDLSVDDSTENADTEDFLRHSGKDP